MNREPSRGDLTALRTPKSAPNPAPNPTPNKHTLPSSPSTHVMITMDLKKWNRIVQFACSHSKNTKLVTFMERIWPAQWPRIESNQPGRVCFMIDPQDKAVLERWAASFVDAPEVPPEFE